MAIDRVAKRAERIAGRRGVAEARVKRVEEASFTDGPSIEEPLLSDLRAAKAELDATRAAIEGHNRMARILTEKAASARAVWMHYEKRAKDSMKLKDGDMLMLQAGIVRVKVL